MELKDLSEKEILKGIVQFRKIKEQSEDKRRMLETNLITEARANGHNNYVHSMSNSIQLETAHITNAEAQIFRYETELHNRGIKIEA